MIEPKSRAGYRLGIVNPLTLAGSEVKSILRERSFPFAKVVMMTSSGEAGALTEMGDEPAVVTAVSDDELEDCDLVFFCGDAEANREWIARYADDRFVAVDLSQPSTVEEGGTILVAGVNLESIRGDERLLVSPHPIAVPLAILLHELEALAPIELCTVTVVQPASELGQAGVEELAKQTINVLNVTSMQKEVFDRQLAFNLFPAPAHRERFIAGQLCALISTRQIALQVTQGTIFHSHTFSLFVKTREPLAIERVIEAFRKNPAIDFAEGDQQFGTIDAAGRDEILIAEIREDAAVENGIWIWAASDNLRRSAALNAVLIAEKVLFGTGAN
jgi:aspartate-semialdehyde dehydrogenase